MACAAAIAPHGKALVMDLFCLARNDRFQGLLSVDADLHEKYASIIAEKAIFHCAVPASLSSTRLHWLCRNRPSFFRGRTSREADSLFHKSSGADPSVSAH